MKKQQVLRLNLRSKAQGEVKSECEFAGRIAWGSDGISDRNGHQDISRTGEDSGLELTLRWWLDTQGRERAGDRSSRMEGHRLPRHKSQL